jgi:hypothetical protein
MMLMLGFLGGEDLPNRFLDIPRQCRVDRRLGGIRSEGLKDDSHLLFAFGWEIKEQDCVPEACSVGDFPPHLESKRGTSALSDED